MALSVIESKLWVIEVVHSRNRNFRPFRSCDLDLDPMTFIYELDPYSLEIYWMCKYELRTSRLSKIIVWQTHRQTDTTEIIYHVASRLVNCNYLKTETIAYFALSKRRFNYKLYIVILVFFTTFCSWGLYDIILNICSFLLFYCCWLVLQLMTHCAWHGCVQSNNVKSVIRTNRSIYAPFFAILNY